MTNKVSYANLKLKVDNEVKTFNFHGQDIEVLQYLPIDDKNDLIEITLQKSQEDGRYNLISLEKYFNLHIVYMYTNLSFTEKQKEDEGKLYDILETNHIFEYVINNMNPDEYNKIFQLLQEERLELIKYESSAAGIINKIIVDLPSHAQAAKDIIDNFDKNKYEEVIRFAEAANGGRAIE